MDANDQVVAHLGGGKGIKREAIENYPTAFLATHALTLDSHGDLYVIEWLSHGRPRQFRNTVA